MADSDRIQRAEDGSEAAMEMVVYGLAMALGIFIAALPKRAAKIWGSEKLDKLASRQKVSFLRWYRVFGILLWLAGALIAIDCIVFPHYSH